MQEFFLQTGLCTFSYAQCSGAHIPGRKRGNKHTCVSHTDAAVLLVDTPRSVSWTESQTCSVVNCSYSQALLLLPPLEHSTAQHPWLTHGTCSSSQNFLPYSKTRTGKCAGNSLHSLDSNRSTYRQWSSSLALTLESSNWEVPKSVRLICLNSTNFGKKMGKHAYSHLLLHPPGRWGGEGVPHSREHHGAEI